MNLRSRSPAVVVLPREVLYCLEEKSSKRWTGTITLNIKDGEVLAFEVTEKRRISREER